MAERFGWTYVAGEQPTYGGEYRQAHWRGPEGEIRETTWDRQCSMGLPGWRYSLSDMHRLERKLNDDEWARFVEHLCLLNGIPCTYTQHTVKSLLLLPAKAHFEALGSSLGLWKTPVTGDHADFLNGLVEEGARRQGISHTKWWTEGEEPVVLAGGR